MQNNFLNTSQATSLSGGRVVELDGLRGISVVVILLFHFGVESLGGGYVGVDVFFVLSGYLITTNIFADLARGTFSVSRFYIRRARRLLPAFFVTLAVTLLAAAFLMSPEHLERLARSSIYSGLSLANFFFFSEAGYFDTSSAFKPLLHFWSLAVEEQFYFVWPGLLLLLWKLSKSRIFLILLIVGMVSLLACELVMRSSTAAAFFMMPLRAYEFALGALCIPLRAQAQTQSGQRIRSVIGVVGLGAVVGSCLLFNETTRFPGVIALLPAGGAALLIISNGAGIAGMALRFRPIVALGTVSYSLYLVHWPIATFYSYWMARPPTLVDTPILLLGSLIVGAALYFTVEVRFRASAIYASGNTPGSRASRRYTTQAGSNYETATNQRPSARSFFCGLTLFACSIFTFAFLVWYDDGMDWRLDPLARVDVVSERSFDCRPPAPSVDIGTFCHLGALEPSQPKMLVIGDSHVEQLRAGFDALGKQHNIAIDFWTSPGCPPLEGTYKHFARNDFGKEEACKTLGSEWEQLIDAGAYPVIALGSRWMWMFEPQNYAEANLPRELLVDRQHPVMTADAARILFNSRLRSTVDRIHAAGSRVIVFSQVPLLARNVQGCDRMPALLYSSNRRAERCSSGVSRDVALDRLNYADESIKAIGDSRTLPVVFSTLLCPDNDSENCLSFVNGRSLYNDDNHLSGFGSHYVTDWLGPDLVDFLRN